MFSLLLPSHFGIKGTCSRKWNIQDQILKLFPSEHFPWHQLAQWTHTRQTLPSTRKETNNSYGFFVLQIEETQQSLQNNTRIKFFPLCPSPSLPFDCTATLKRARKGKAAPKTALQQQLGKQQVCPQNKQPICLHLENRKEQLFILQKSWLYLRRSCSSKCTS